MKSFLALCLLTAAALSLSPAAEAGFDQISVTKVAAETNAEKAFERIKSLEGSWVAKLESGDEVRISFEVVSGGHAVISRLWGMLDVFHLDGDQLMMTHYCSAGNQPRMVAVAPSNPDDSIDFKVIEVTNLKESQGGHISGLKLTLKDSNTLVQTWSDRNIKTGEESSFDLVFQRAK